MSMTGTALAAARQAAMDAVTFTQTNNASDAQAYRSALLLADSTAIVTYIQTAARCSGNDSRGDTHDNVQIV